MPRWMPRTSTKVRGDRGGGGGVIFRTSSRSYEGQWTNDRAMREAMQRVTWIFRCVQAIASNQAGLPLVFRKGDAETGQEIRNHPLYPVLNSRSNIGEDSHTFRHRVSAQLLLSNKGVFIEVVRNRANEILALILQPPDSVKPLKDPTTFVSGYEVTTIDNGVATKTTIKPENMMWLRMPHPFDPYGAVTPLESAGLAIETDWLARLYNRNFLINDGRPGGLIVVKGVMNDDDKEELRSRYRGNINTAGRIGVIASDEGADFVDTAVHPRDAQYIEARNISKDEILMAYGVPQSVLANAAGRTFDNAEQERLIFWMETMKGTHLPLIARPLDVLDVDPTVFCAFDTSGVDVIQRAEMKRRDFLLKEFDQGLATQNEYRLDTGRSKLAEGGDVLYIPSTYMAIGSTKKGALKEATDQIAASKPQPAAGGSGSGRTPGRPQDEPHNQDGEDPESTGRPAGTRKPRTGQSEQQGRQAASAGAVIPITIKVEHESTQPKELPPARKVVNLGLHPVDEEDLEHFKTRTLDDYERWETVVERTLHRFLERQQRVVTEKLIGTKTKRRLAHHDVDDLIASVYDEDVWNKQMEDDLDPLIGGIMQEFGEHVSQALMTTPFQATSDAALEARKKQLAVLILMNGTTKRYIEDILADGVTDAETADELADKVTKMFTETAETRAPMASTLVVVAAGSVGKLLAAEEYVASFGSGGAVDTGDESGVAPELRKTWVTVGDDRVRDTHDDVEGQSMPLDGLFKVGDSLMSYPGDPAGDPEEVINCRCSIVIETGDGPILDA